MEINYSLEMIKDRLTKIVALIDSREFVVPIIDRFNDEVSSHAKVVNKIDLNVLVCDLIGDLFTYSSGVTNDLRAKGNSVNSSKDEDRAEIADLKLEIELLKKENESLMENRKPDSKYTVDIERVDLLAEIRKLTEDNNTLSHYKKYTENVESDLNREINSLRNEIGIIKNGPYYNNPLEEKPFRINPYK